MSKIDAVLFDKDGTLFDFSATWDTWAAGVIADFAGGDMALARRLAEGARYDLEARRFLPDSPVIAGTNREAAECFAGALSDWSLAEIEAHLSTAAATAPLAQAVPLEPFLTGLRGLGLRLGVMTNDAEAVAHAHLGQAGVSALFDFVAGFDSGFGGKPSPEPLWAFCDHIGCDPSRTIMVGDSTHDLVAGRAAGMGTVGVLTGLATEADLSPLADVVLPHIGYLTDWVSAR